MLDSFDVPGWIYYVVDKLTSCKATDPFFIVLTNNSKLAAGADRAPILFRSWAALDRWVRRSRTDALQLRDCSLLLKSRSIPVVLLQTRDNGTLSEMDIALIKAANLDLLLYLGRGVPGDEISACAGQGAWSMQWGALCGSAAVPGQFWDMYEGNRVTRYGPQVIEQKRNWTRVAYRSSTITSFLSLALNQNAASWEIAHVLVTQLSDEERR